MINSDTLAHLWRYFVSLAEDLEKTSRYVEPSQTEVFSLEFLKIITLASSEIETIFQLLCSSLSDGKSTAGNIGEYKEREFQKSKLL